MTAGATDVPSDLLSYALRYAARGWYVFPVWEIRPGPPPHCACPRGKNCTESPGKHPRTSNGFKAATIDPDQIREWWRIWPFASIGIECERSGLLILDIDPRNDGDDNLRALLQIHGPLPPTPMVLTGGGGEHYFFSTASPMVSRKIRKGVDIKSAGGYVVGCPSLHLSGGRYLWDSGTPEFTEPLAPVPEWITTALAVAVPYLGTAIGKVLDGFVGKCFQEAGWLGRQISDSKTCARCPWLHLHTSPRGRENLPNEWNHSDSSSAVLAPSTDRMLGFFRCQHEHCRDRSPQEVYQAMPPGVVERVALATGVRNPLSGLAAVPYSPVLSQPDPTTRDFDLPPFDENPAESPESVIAKRAPEEWEQNLTWGEKGIKTVVSNAITIFKHEASWHGPDGHVLRFDQFRFQPVISRSFRWHEDDAPPGTAGSGPGPDFAPFDEEDHTRLVSWLCRSRWRLKLSKEIAYAAMCVVAAASPIHPVREYLRSLKWDGSFRIDHWLTSYLGADPTDYSRNIGRWWLISAVARVMRPGCKADHVLILEGPQGAMKSTALRALVGAPWFTDTSVEIGGKDAYMQMRGKWVIELAELDSLSRAESSRAKAFLSSAADNYRPPYGHAVVEIDRQCVFAGTVNHGAYLKDETGGRRYWPVMCGVRSPIDISALEAERDQLWAEAREAFVGGAKWYPSSQQEHLQCAGEQETRFAADAWENKIADFVRSPSRCGQTITIADILGGPLEMKPGTWTKPDQMRVGTCLTRLGCRKTRCSEKGHRFWGYLVPDTWT